MNVFLSTIKLKNRKHLPSATKRVQYTSKQTVEALQIPVADVLQIKYLQHVI